MQHPGQDLSCWPAPLLELVLGYLGPADLARAGRVCRQWYQVASNPLLQARSLVQSYPRRHQKRLQQAMKNRLAPQLLRHWGEQLPPGCAARAERERLLAGSTPSWKRLFHAQTQQLRDAERILVSLDPTCIHDCTMLGLDTLWSPDGTHLGLCNMLQPDCFEISLLQQHLTGMQPAQLCPPACEPGPCHSLTFSEDSSQLLVVTEDGCLMTWHRLDDRWQIATNTRLCTGEVHESVFSPDARCLALAMDGSVLLFHEVETGVWQQAQAQRCLEFTDEETIDFYVRMSVMQFGDDSRHFLYGFGDKVFIFDCRDNHWRAQQIAERRHETHYVSGRFSPGCDWLAMTSINPGRDIPTQTHDHSLELWRYTQGAGWTFVSSRLFAGLELRPDVVFAPDGQQLAFPDLLDDGTRGLTVLSLARAHGWQLAARLQFGSDTGPMTLLNHIESLSYSAHGQYLAATARQGVQLWHRGTTAAWTPLGWIESFPAEPPIEFVFAPDGYHCAVSMGELGTLSIHGPLPGGGYGTKVVLTLGFPLFQMLFSPDGQRLTLLGADDQSDGGCLCFVQLTPALDRHPDDLLPAMATEADDSHLDAEPCALPPVEYATPAEKRNESPSP